MFTGPDTPTARVCGDTGAGKRRRLERMTLSVLFSRPRGKLAQNDGFEIEWAAMSHLEVESHVIDIEHIVDGDADVACEDLPRRKTWLYRGYILTQEEYEALYEAVGDRGGRLVVDPQE